MRRTTIRSLAAVAAVTLAIPLVVAGCIYAPLDLGLGDIGKVQEITLVEGTGDAKILMLRIDGEITDEGEGRGFFGSSEGTTAQVKDVLDLARTDPEVAALIVRINSPGGGVTASDILHREISQWKKETGKPVVALFMDTAASGGYYAAMAADRVIAHPTCITGSIGVIAMFPDVSELAAKVGVKVHTVKSGKSKDMGNPFRPFAPEDEKLFQGLIDQAYTRFVDVVVEGRKGKLTRDRVRALADGRVYTANDAKAAGLIDETGYFDDAIAATKKLAGLSDARVVAYERKGFGAGRRTIYSHGFVEPIEASVIARGEEGDRNVVKIDAGPVVPNLRPQLKYIWLPGF